MPLLPERFGAYLLHERIGRGGMAEVWRATRADDASAEPVALKRLLPGLEANAAAVAQFAPMMADEARLLQALDHPAIVRLVDHGTVGGQPYAALELVQGTDLFGLLQTLHARGRTMPPALAAYVLAQVCDGLHHAHTRNGTDGTPLGIIHRDVSPQNVLISWQGAVKLSDFGVARAATRLAVTDAGLVKGKMYYMAPEQLLGQPLDSRADQFAAGILLYECLTAEPLYKASEPKRLHQQVANAQYAWPAESLSRVPAALRAVVDRALRRLPDERFADCAHMREALLAAASLQGPLADAVVFGGWLRQLYAMSEPTSDAAADAAAVTQAIDAVVLRARLQPPPQPVPASRPTTPRPQLARPASAPAAEATAPAKTPPQVASHHPPAPPGARGPAEPLDAPASTGLFAATVAVWLAAAAAVVWAAWVSLAGK